MPCDRVVKEKSKEVSKRQKVKVEVPPDITEKEVRDLAGAIDHEGFDKMMKGMDDQTFIEFTKRLWARRKKRAEVLKNYIAQEARSA